MFSKAPILAVVLAAVALSVKAGQATTPPYIGAVLLQAGNDASKCLRADNRNGAPVVLTTCTGGDDQEWTWKNGAVTLHKGGKCLDVAKGNTANGAKLQVADCGGPNQQFTYTPWGENHIQWNKNRKCMDIPGGRLDNGNQVQLWDCGNSPNQNWDTGYMYNNLPDKCEIGQKGTNRCPSSSSLDSSMCQTMWMNDADDFCLWAPASPNAGTIGATEREEVAWCTKGGRGTRVIPNGTLKGVHFVKTKDYVQVTGVGDFTKINVQKGDGGGELDPHGPDGNGNPIGGLVYGNSFGQHLQYHEWTSFISDKEFCMRACVGPNAKENCQHIYDEMGCYWNMPANYDAGKFESCQGEDAEPMGVYGTSTWHQGEKETPAAHPVPASSACKSYPTIASGSVKRDLSLERLVRRAPFPEATPVL